MANLEELTKFESTESQMQVASVFAAPDTDVMSALRSMDSGRSNQAADDMLSGFLVVDEKSTGGKDAGGDQVKTEEQAKPLELADAGDKVDQSFEQAEKLKNQAIQDCRDGKFGDALKHKSEALKNYYEFYEKNPADTPEELKQQKETYYQLNLINSIAINKIKCAPNWEPAKGSSAPSMEDARPKPKFDQTPINEMIAPKQ